MGGTPESGRYMIGIICQLFSLGITAPATRRIALCVLLCNSFTDSVVRAVEFTSKCPIAGTSRRRELCYLLYCKALAAS